MSSSSRLSLVHGSPGTEDSDHLSQDLPSTVQYNRQESSHSMTSSSRLQAYSDAIFSIIATVMILPIAHAKIEPHASFESTFMTVLALLLVAYLLSFFVVSAAWAGHVWVFQTIAKADDVIVLLNLGILMVVTFLPFSFTLYGLFANYFIPILVFCLSVILIGFLQALIVLYAFKYDSKILTADLNANPEKNKTKRGLLQVILTNPAICVVSLLLSAISYSLSHVAILLILFGQPLRKLVFSIYNKCKKCGQANMPHLEYIPDKYTQEKLSMERIEAFSDGVFAIVATLIILDICEDDIPDQDDVEKMGGSLDKALLENGSVYLSYIGTFTTVGMLWFVHHSLCHYIMECNRTMSFFNTMSLSFIGCAPLAFKLTSTYVEFQFVHNERYAIQFNCFILFMASIFQLLTFITALCKPFYRMHPSASYHGQEHAYLTAKLCIFPLVSLVIFFLGFKSDILSAYVFNFMQIGIPGLFILLRLLFYACQRLKLYYHSHLDRTEHVQYHVTDEQNENNGSI